MVPQAGTAPREARGELSPALPVCRLLYSAFFAFYLVTTTLMTPDASRIMPDA